jgi:hypothetical protein
VADKSSQLMLQALGRAVADPAGLPLFSQKAGPGLFAGTAAARHAAQRCKELDLLRVVRTEARGQAVHEVVAITPKGLDHLLCQVSPRQVLEDLVRALESRDKQLGDLVASARDARTSLDAMKGLTTTVLQRVQQAACSAAAAELAPSILQVLGQWQATDAAKDCPLPHLFRALTGPVPSIGTFHDGLRLLHNDQQIYLHPWTGPLYDLPEPPLALLVGHEIAYYASLRS